MIIMNHRRFYLVLLVARLTHLVKGTSKKTKDMTKIIVIGPQGSGKTRVIQHYLDGKSNYKYIILHNAKRTGKTIYTTIVHIDKETEPLHVRIWDIASQQSSDRIKEQLYTIAKAAVVVVDVTQEWDKMIAQAIQYKKDVEDKVRLPNGEPIPVVLFLNKYDLLPQNTYLPALDEVRKAGFLNCYVTSAKEGSKAATQIEDGMTELLSLVVENNRKIKAAKRHQEAIADEEAPQPNHDPQGDLLQKLAQTAQRLRPEQHLGHQGRSPPIGKSQPAQPPPKRGAPRETQEVRCLQPQTPLNAIIEKLSRKRREMGMPAGALPQGGREHSDRSATPPPGVVNGASARDRKHIPPSRQFVPPVNNSAFKKGKVSSAPIRPPRSTQAISGHSTPSRPGPGSGMRNVLDLRLLDHPDGVTASSKRSATPPPEVSGNMPSAHNRKRTSPVPPVHRPSPVEGQGVPSASPRHSPSQTNQTGPGKQALSRDAIEGELRDALRQRDAHSERSASATSLPEIAKKGARSRMSKQRQRAAAKKIKRAIEEKAYFEIFLKYRLYFLRSMDPLPSQFLEEKEFLENHESVEPRKMLPMLKKFYRGNRSSPNYAQACNLAFKSLRGEYEVVQIYRKRGEEKFNKFKEGKLRDCELVTRLSHRLKKLGHPEFLSIQTE